MSKPRFTNHLPQSTLKSSKGIKLTAIQQHQLWLHEASITHSKSFTLASTIKTLTHEVPLLHINVLMSQQSSFPLKLHGFTKTQKLNLLISTKNYIRILPLLLINSANIIYIVVKGHKRITQIQNGAHNLLTTLLPNLKKGAYLITQKTGKFLDFCCVVSNQNISTLITCLYQGSDDFITMEKLT